MTRVRRAALQVEEILARFVEDQAQKEALWSPMAKAWFPGGVTDPDLALLAVRHGMIDASN